MRSEARGFLVMEVNSGDIAELSPFLGLNMTKQSVNDIELEKTAIRKAILDFYHGEEVILP